MPDALGRFRVRRPDTASSRRVFANSTQRDTTIGRGGAWLLSGSTGSPSEGQRSPWTDSPERPRRGAPRDIDEPATEPKTRFMAHRRPLSRRIGCEPLRRLEGQVSCSQIRPRPSASQTRTRRARDRPQRCGHLDGRLPSPAHPVGLTPASPRTLLCCRVCHTDVPLGDSYPGSGEPRRVE
jgi:hypothetical protein